MQLDILNFKLLTKVEPTFSISFDDIYEGYLSLFKELDLEDINIVFVDLEYIRELNYSYREIDAPTDVLSFDIEGDKKGGEIYISPEYVYQSFQGEEFEEEVLRLIIHGTLHILGHEHIDSLNDTTDEDMFLLQEDLLKKYKKLCS